MYLSVVVVCCWLSVSVCGSCFFVGCRVYLSVIVVCCWLSGVSVCGSCLLLVVGCICPW
jgi:hypothetical protein